MLFAIGEDTLLVGSDDDGDVPMSDIDRPERDYAPFPRTLYETELESTLEYESDA